ncbi:MAG: hypothetical protein A2Y07_09745 [Planctomycetes bacterium GWF2_50_10]|nr:MAG: hypothetical protein A2Y07_09745 [Planctomycetes bacterium GWF2_50_10]
MKLSSHRAQLASLTAGILSVVFFLIVLLLGNWSTSFAVKTIAWQILAGAMVWLVLTVQFKLQSMAAQEKLEIAQLSRLGETTTIFNAPDGQMLATSQKRLALFEKWFLPGFAVFISLYQIGIGLYLYKGIAVYSEFTVSQPLVGAGFMLAMAFLSFLLARYAIGMSVEPEWRPLRSGGGYMLATAILCLAAAIALALVQFKSVIMIKMMVWVVPVLLVVLGFETLFNFIMDIYRPRLRGQYSRAAFESRILGLISEPGGIIATAASALDYQFGFKVSNTWFFQLLGRAVVPLILFSAVVVYLLSTIVVIGPQEQGIIERFGKPMANKAVIGSGLHWKMPWPIDIAYVYPVYRVQQVNVGFKPETDKDGVTKRQPLLWDVEHFEQEYNLLTATYTTSSIDEGAVPVSIIRAAIPVQYKVKDLYSFLYKHKDSQQLLEDICYREVVQFVASAVIDPEISATKGNVDLLGAGRGQAAHELKQRIQKHADDMGLGIEVVFLGLQGFHPPPKVAEDYEKVIGAVQKKQSLILGAMAQRNRLLTNLAGSVEKADELYQVSSRYQAQKDPAMTPEKVDEAFGNAQGDIYATLSQAKSYAYEKSALAKADSERFVGQLQAYRASNSIFKNEYLLSMLEEALEPIRKYIVAADSKDSEVLIIDLQEKLTPSLYDISGLEEPKK